MQGPSGAGFGDRHLAVASIRLTNVIAASLAIGALSLSLAVALTVLSLKAAMAMPIPV